MRFLQPILFKIVFTCCYDLFTIPKNILKYRPVAHTWAAWVPWTSVPYIMSSWSIFIDQCTKNEQNSVEIKTWLISWNKKGLLFQSAGMSGGTWYMVWDCFVHMNENRFFLTFHIGLWEIFTYFSWSKQGMTPFFGLVKYEWAGSKRVCNIDNWKRWFWIPTCYLL